MDFWILLKILVKNIVGNIGKNLSGKYRQKLFHDAKWRPYEGDKELIFKNYEQTSKQVTNNNKQVDNAKDLDVVLPTNKLIEYSDNYSETGTLQYYSDEPNDNLANSESFKSKVKIIKKHLLMVIQKMLKYQYH